ncbi:class I SAM-dependent methyltransferase [Desulfococcaceae bacterium HSG7]|nr:class I SAM-dependent methyltransferase [Desulfococcaceae bacterium HSG7]
MNKIDYTSHNWLAFKINNESFQRHLSLIKGRAIDLGCGTAQYKDDILKVADKYIGVDWESSYHNQDNVDVFANLTKKLPFQDNYADTVVSFQVLEHLPDPNFFLSECFRILKFKGTLLLTAPFMWHVHESPYDYFRYTRYGLEYILKKVGFVNIEIKENTGFWQTFVLKFNYHTTRFSFGFLRYLWVPVWWIGQVIAPILDKYDNHPEECASYTVLAEKR